MQDTTPEVKAKAKGLSLRLIIVFALFAVVLLLFYLLTDEVVFEKENTFDTAVYARLSSYATPQLTRIMTFLTFFGSRDFLLPAYLCIAAYFLVFKKNRANSLSIAAVGLSGAGVLFILKQTFQRHRPLKPLLENVDGFSYPSGHSFSAFTFSGVLIYIVWHTKLSKGWKWLLTILLFLFALLIAFTRVYLHVHFPSDVIAGFILSLVWLLLSYMILLRTGNLKHSQPV